MGFAARLRQERLRRHLSQETLAEALGVSARTVSRWEQGQGMPQAILRVRLSSYLGLSPEAFFEESETLASLVLKDAEKPNEAFSQTAPTLPEDAEVLDEAFSQPVPALPEDAEVPDEAFSQPVPALPEKDLRDHAASVSLSQDTKASGRSTSRQPFYRRNILLGLGMLGLLVLAIGPLATLSVLVLKGAEPHVTAVANHNSAPSMSSTALTSGDRGTYICWGAHVHLPAQCMNLKDDKFSRNQPISLWSSLSGNGLGWNISIQGNVTSIWPFTVSFLNTKYRGDTVAYFEKTIGGTGHNGCIGIHANVGLAWEPCGSPDTYWVISAYGYLVSVSNSNRIGAPTAAGACDSSNGGSISLGIEHKRDQCLGPWTLLP